MEMKLPKRKDIKTESPIEDIMLRELRILDIHPVPQFKVGNYRIDLAIPEALVAIECDGAEWHSSPEQIERDRIRDEFLKENGWRVIRITGSDIYRHADEIANMLVNGKRRVRAKESHISIPKIDEESGCMDLIEESYQKRQTIEEEMEEYHNEQMARPFESIQETMNKRFKDFL